MHRLVALTIVLAACSSAPSRNNHDDGGGPGSDGSGSGSATFDELRFAIVGDTRPMKPDDTPNYPSDVITKIYQDIEAENPKPQFAVGTGDYMFASTYKSEQIPQLTKYMAARAGFDGPLYPAMGNHECTGATDSDCGAGNRDGITKNMSDFIQMMLMPVGINQPNYVQNIAAKDGSWTAKLVFVACNAWDSNQATWLDQQLAPTTTYTFVVRHEGTFSLSQTKCQQSQTIIDAHPLTLLIVGHTHTYAHYSSSKEVVVGNGGAPLTTGLNWGYVVVARNSNGTLTVTAYDYMTHQTLDTFTIQASGASA
jgi:hypothetical protein